jgi:Ca2+-binding RTX toxin-like protein
VLVGVMVMAGGLLAPRSEAAVDPCANPGPFKPAYPGGAIVGTNGDDVIRGHEAQREHPRLRGNDTICGLGGDDLIKGAQGNDRIYGGSGRDALEGSYGDDELYGGPTTTSSTPGSTTTAENDFCNGGKGTDREITDGFCDTSLSIER